MTEANPNDASPISGIVMLVLFLVLVGIGIATVAVPELTNAPEASERDGGTADPAP